MAEVIPFPTGPRAIARPQRTVRLSALAIAVVGTVGTTFLLGQRLRSGTLLNDGVTALLFPLAMLAIMAWVAWYALRCRFEVGPAGVQFFGFLPSRLVPLKELEEIAVVHVAERPGQRADRSHIRMRRRGSLAPFKLWLAWEGADQVVAALERLAHRTLRYEEAS